MLTVREHVQASAVKQLADLQVESLMKPDDAAKRLLEIASMVETSPEGRIFVERVTVVFLNEGGEAYEYRAGIELLKRDGLIDMHDSGTFFRFTEKSAQRFA